MELNTNKTGTHRFGEMDVYWEQFGRGSHHILAFHGYGLRCNAFQFLSEELDSDKFTIHALGLFQHESSFPKERIPNHPLEPAELKALIESYLEANDIETFSLMGYSIGGRICFQILQLLPDKIDGMLVAAPDGIVKNQWYSILMSSKFMGKIYLFMLQQTIIHRTVLGFLRTLRLLDEESLEIATAQVANKKRANRVYETWSVYRHIFPKPENWMKIISSHNIPSIFYFGSKDEIIGKEAVRKLERLIQPPAKLVMINEGHMLLKAQYARENYRDTLEGFTTRTIT